MFRLTVQRMKTYQHTSFDKQNQHVSQMLARSTISTSSTALALGANTIIPMSLLQQNLTSSLSHMQRVADYIELGQGFWYTANQEFIEFHDGFKEPNFRAEGPRLTHFRYSSIFIFATLCCQIYK